MNKLNFSESYQVDWEHHPENVAQLLNSVLGMLDKPNRDNAIARLTVDSPEKLNFSLVVPHAMVVAAKLSGSSLPPHFIVDYSNSVVAVSFGVNAQQEMRMALLDVYSKENLAAKLSDKVHHESKDGDSLCGLINHNDGVEITCPYCLAEIWARNKLKAVH